jgi:hypothetical protein
MDSRRGPPPGQAPTPEPLDGYWLISILPDVLYVPPPDAIAAHAHGERTMDALLITSMTIAAGLLILIIVLMTAVA